MEMPSVNVSFTEKAITAIKRGDRGIVGLILKEITLPNTNPAVIYNITDIPEGLTEDNQEQIKLALMGYVNAPKKILAFFITDETTDDYTPALTYFGLNKVDYIVAPASETDTKTADIVTWVKAQRDSGKKVKAVLPNTVADCEGIINFATVSVTAGDKTYTTEQYCSRIAGIIAGTPLTISCVNAPLTELTDCTRLTKSDMDTAVDAGKFIVFFDGEKVKVGRGVNSLTTTTSDKGDQFKKIKIVDTMDMIFDDITKTAEDNYLGKYANSYDNKCLLISAIGAYFEQMVLDDLLTSATVGIDIATQRTYLKGIGIDTDEMSDDEVKVYDTGDKVFLKASVKIMDAIEEINLPITI
jgi:hypothetical protein